MTTYVSQTRAKENPLQETSRPPFTNGLPPARRPWHRHLYRLHGTSSGKFSRPIYEAICVIASERMGKAMDVDSWKDSEAVRLGFGLALVVLCLGIGFHYALDRILTSVRESMTGGFGVVNDADSIMNGLDRLNLNQRFFLRTGDLHFSQDMYESVTEIERHMDSLRQIAQQGSQLRGPIARLDRGVDGALDSLRRSNDLDKSKGSAEAIALLDRDESIPEGRREAEQLRKLAAQGIFDHVRNQRQMESILAAVF